MTGKEVYTRQEFSELKGLSTKQDFKSLQVGKVYEVWQSDALKDDYYRRVIKILSEKKCEICHFKYKLLFPERLKGKVVESPFSRMVAFRELSKQETLFQS